MKLPSMNPKKIRHGHQMLGFRGGKEVEKFVRTVLFLFLFSWGSVFPSTAVGSVQKGPRYVKHGTWNELAILEA